MTTWTHGFQLHGREIFHPLRPPGPLPENSRDILATCKTFFSMRRRHEFEIPSRGAAWGGLRMEVKVLPQQ
jgi:hypothetical protein